MFENITVQAVVYKSCELRLLIIASRRWTQVFFFAKPRHDVMCVTRRVALRFGLMKKAPHVTMRKRRRRDKTETRRRVFNESLQIRASCGVLARPEKGKGGVGIQAANRD